MSMGLGMSATITKSVVLLMTSPPSSLLTANYNADILDCADSYLSSHGTLSDMLAHIPKKICVTLLSINSDIAIARN